MAELKATPPKAQSPDQGDPLPFTWLDLIDAALCELPPPAFTALVARAQSLLQDVLNGHVPVQELLRPVVTAEMSPTFEGKFKRTLADGLFEPGGDDGAA